jgi:probable selenium-dependent hydroxylase accessory protein YqeC
MTTTNEIMIRPSDCVAVVGAGGKTTLCWMLVQQLARHGERALFTTTTHIRQPAPGTFDLLHIGNLAETLAALRTRSWRTACIASEIAGDPDDTPLAESRMPALHTKLRGFTSQDICDLRASLAPQNSLISNPQSPISIIVEADGARGLWLKAPAEHEPAIPPCATVVCVVANLQALGKPLDERVAHRPERFARLAGIAEGQLVTPQVLIDTLAHPQGGLKGIPPEARKVAVLMAGGAAAPAEAETITSSLTARGFDQVVVMD